ncbi:MAG: YfiR family protein [Bacteroidales bacterium]|nr:YfiR family protein [Bacteroidales bacterium]
MKKITWIVILFLVFGCFTSNAQEEKYISLFLYNFSKHFDWPQESKSGDFVIEILGHKSVFDELEKIVSMKKVGNQDIVVRNFSDYSQLGNGQILFVGYWHNKYLPEIVNKCRNKNVLIVTENEGSIEKGSAINFLILNGTIKFEMSKSNTVSHNLKIDPRIEQLAIRVIE